MKLKNATVLITGGASGIGLEIARQLIARGNTVIAIGRDPARLARAQEALPALHVVAADVSDPASLARLRAEVEQRFPALDVLVNCAGRMRKIDLREPRSPEDLALEIDTNLKGTIWTVAEFLPLLARQPHAAIVNVSSALAFVPMAISPVYSASKAGLQAYTRALRGQLAHTRIQVFELAPPATATPLLAHEAFTAADTHRSTPMSVEVVVAQTLRGLERNRPEIRPGTAGVLRILSRLAPDWAFRKVNAGSLALMAAARPT